METSIFPWSISDKGVITELGTNEPVPFANSFDSKTAKNNTLLAAKGPECAMYLKAVLKMLPPQYGDNLAIVNAANCVIDQIEIQIEGRTIGRGAQNDNG